MEKKFRLISLIFLVSCVVFYGARFGYFYLKFNTNTSKKIGSSLGLTIQSKGVTSKGDGVYSNSGELVFKGTNVNNYVMYSNMLFRIVKVNRDNSVMLVTDSTISELMFDNSKSNYTNSNINDYLENVFYTKLNNPKKYLTNNTICEDIITDASNLTCNNKKTSKVGLISIADYLNSKNEDSYLNNTSSFWLYNPKDSNTSWYISEGNLGNSNIKNIHGVKAVITLKNTVNSIKGNGSKEKPYIIDNNKEISFNDYVKLGNDLYQIYDIKDSYYLVNTNLVDDVRNRSVSYYNYKYDIKTPYSLALYLNNYYLNSLSYKDNLVDCELNVGDYKTSYKDIYSEKIKAKIGLLSIGDINTNSDLKNYLLLNRHDDIVMSKDGEYSTNKIRNTVCISKDSKLKGDGTLKSPYVLEG